jgi:hypothetical protein
MRANRTQIQQQIEREKGQALAPLMNKYLPENGGEQDWAAYKKERGPVAREYEERLEQALQKFNAQYEKEKSIHRSISLNIARLSPASTYSQVALDLCHTGVADLENFSQSLQAYYILLYEALFQYQWNDTVESEDGKSAREMGGTSLPSRKYNSPNYRYRFLAFEQTLRATAPDIILLVLFNLIFFTAAYYSFARYDVR